MSGVSRLSQELESRADTVDVPAPRPLDRGLLPPPLKQNRWADFRIYEGHNKWYNFPHTTRDLFYSFQIPTYHVLLINSAAPINPVICRFVQFRCAYSGFGQGGKLYHPD